MNRAERMDKVIIKGFALSLLLSASSMAANADDAAQFYAGKTLAFIVASGPGGGYDLYARLLARHYPKYLPGNPSIAIQYVPGGGGIVAANNIAGLARRDGTAIGLLASSTFVLAAVGDPQTKFENLKFTFVGNMNEEVDTCSTWHTSGFNSVDDIKQREAIFGTAGVGSNSHTFPMAMNELLGTKFKLIPGYQGGAHVRTIAMERKELDGSCGIFVSTLGAQFKAPLANNQLKVVLQMGLSRHPLYKDVPNALELAPNEAARAVLELLFAQLTVGRPIVAPPDVPKPQADALQKAFDQAMSDPQMLADAEKSGVELRWFGSSRMKDEMLKMESAPASVKSNVRRILNPQ
jgi:tripartite-type tricarboxylate transporter receptor subunit TctC